MPSCADAAAPFPALRQKLRKTMPVSRRWKNVWKGPGGGGADYEAVTETSEAIAALHEAEKLLLNWTELFPKRWRNWNGENSVE